MRIRNWLIMLLTSVIIGQCVYLVGCKLLDIDFYAVLLTIGIYSFLHGFFWDQITGLKIFK